MCKGSAAIMEMKGVFLSFCLCVLLATCTDAAPKKCCIATVPFQQAWMWRIWKISFQFSVDECDVNAGILRLKGQKNPVCIDIEKAKEVRKELKKQKRHVKAQQV
ncbi:hypothetical protein OJAV_G00087880 [Oryzias javanicus]|uniref:Chemokine interleukin-8-like domain-containing protein n=1 Tax=Oryzias javanicus TaxID=123683 RepID=A0A3S2P6U8_ORYJA|nr:hypothetical protein OJAV_G00087880 [Oryzias javanicus]